MIQLNDAAQTWQLDQIRRAIAVYDHLIKTTDPQVATSARDGDDGWTVLQVMGHLNDFEAIFLERARLTITAENPVLPFPDPDALAIANHYQEQDLMTVLSQWQDRRREYLAFLEARDDADWPRMAQHPTRGPFSLLDQLFLAVWHDTNHLEQITKILGQTS